MLIYAGTYDWQCNWVANRVWVERMWEGFRMDREGVKLDDGGERGWRKWWVASGGEGKQEGEEAGVTKREGLLTFATVKGAGHMVCSL